MACQNPALAGGFHLAKIDAATPQKKKTQTQPPQRLSVALFGWSCQSLRHHPGAPRFWPGKREKACTAYLARDKRSHKVFAIPNTPPLADDPSLALSLLLLHAPPICCSLSLLSSFAPESHSLFHRRSLYLPYHRLDEPIGRAHSPLDQHSSCSNRVGPGFERLQLPGRLFSLTCGRGCEPPCGDSFRRWPSSKSLIGKAFFEETALAYPQPPFLDARRVATDVVVIQGTASLHSSGPCPRVRAKDESSKDPSLPPPHQTSNETKDAHMMSLSAQ